MRHEHVCRNTLPWLIFFSLDQQRREITSLRRALPSVDPQKIFVKSGKEI